MTDQPFHIFIKTGDARAEVDAALAALGSGSPRSKGFQKVLHVTRAGQTVVFLTGPGTPLAAALRGRPGWVEPERGGTDA
jgi:hypothetical protein